MIVSGGSRANWRYFAKHLTNEQENDSVRLIEFRGLAAETPLGALREMDALASDTRCENHLYHANINQQAHETLTAEQWEQAVDMLEKELGLEGHSRFVVEHEKEGRTHRHVIWSRINPDSLTAAPCWRDYEKHQAAARQMEKAFGLEPVASSLGPDRVKREKERRPKNWEIFRGQQTGIDPAQVKEQVTALWRETTGGQDFAAALEENGYILCKGDRRDFCIIDRAGDEHSLARRIEGAKAKEIRERLSDIDREALPSVAEGRAMAAERTHADTTGPPAEQEAEQAREPERPQDKEPVQEAVPAPEVRQETEPLPSQALAQSPNPVDRDLAQYAAQFEEHGRLLTVPSIVQEWEQPPETGWGRACRVAQRLYDAFEQLYDRAMETARGWAQRVTREREPEKDFERER